MTAHRLYAESRTPKKFAGESTARGLIEWLNCALSEAREGNEQASHSSVRVLTLAVLFHKLLREKSVFDAAYLAKTVSSAVTFDFVTTQSALRQQINDILARYSVVPMVGGKKLLRLSGRSDQDSFKCDVLESSLVGLRVSFTEADAALSLFQLAEEGHLGSVRPCRVCQKIYYSHNKRSTFCSNACRVRFYNETDAAKQKRRENSAKWRRDDKEREERAKKVAGYKSTKRGRS